MVYPHRHISRRWARLVAVVAAVGLALPALAGAAGASSPQRPGSSKTQKSGGNLTFGLEAETTNYCLPRAQLAESGIQVAAAIYDTLMVPNDKGVPVPYLAKSVTPNADSTQWTITLRPGINFQNGEPFDANAVKQNLDSYRGAPGAPNSGPLFSIVLQFISDVSVVDLMTVKVTLKTGNPDFPAYLYSNGRMGMVAPAQLNAGDACATKMIGTGPFKLPTGGYLQNEKTVVVKNPSYWQAGYPKADSITFMPVPDGAVRNNQLQGGQLDLMQQSDPLEVDNLRSLGSQVKLLTQKPGTREIAQYWVISKNAPFNSQVARTAFATAVNRAEILQIRAKNVFQLANSISDVGTPGYLKNAGYPAFNLKKAQALVQQVKAQNGGQFNIKLGTTTDPSAGAEAQLLKEQLAKAGISSDIQQFDQATLISQALAGSIDVLLWRNLYGDYTNLQDFDTYTWFANVNHGYLTNFGNYNDDQIQALLDQGRAASTLAQAKPIYQQINKLLAQRGYQLPTWFVDWTIGYQNSVHLTFPPLPDGSKPAPFGDGHIPVLGLTKG